MYSKKCLCRARRGEFGQSWSVSTHLGHICPTSCRTKTRAAPFSKTIPIQSTSVYRQDGTSKVHNNKKGLCRARPGEFRQNLSVSTHPDPICLPPCRTKTQAAPFSKTSPIYAVYRQDGNLKVHMYNKKCLWRARRGESQQKQSVSTHLSHICSPPCRTKTQAAPFYKTSTIQATRCVSSGWYFKGTYV